MIKITDIAILKNSTYITPIISCKLHNSQFLYVKVDREETVTHNHFCRVLIEKPHTELRSRVFA